MKEAVYDVQEVPFLAVIIRECPHCPDRPMHHILHMVGIKVKFALLIQV